jgi:pteridine reductase
MKTSDSNPSPGSGTTALVTGSSRRLGRAIALALGRAGYRVALHYRRDANGSQETRRLLASLGVDAPCLQADLADPRACERLIDQAHAALGSLDVLVNNAAMFERTPLATMTAADFEHHMAANAGSVYALSLHAGRRMVEAGAGAIVNIACVSAARPWAAYVPYSASKAAVVNLTRGFARALAPAVRVNAVSPGPILPPAGADASQGDAAVKSTLLGRWGQPDDISAAVMFLLRAQYLTGVVLNVDGGRSIA